MRNKTLINNRKETVMKLNFEELGWDPNNVEEVGKGTKVAALKDIGTHNQDFDNLEELYTNEFFKDGVEWDGGDALADVAEWEDIEGGF
tara:strand:+ start:487 stop:753 length:267 start_codon:yes stop_codon:yes gene_type:complete